MDLTRIGVEFSSLSDDASTGIAEYVAERERQTGLAVFEDN
jgi:c-di-GMP-binding flagellar brake protein YcgR